MEAIVFDRDGVVSWIGMEDLIRREAQRPDTQVCFWTDGAATQEDYPYVPLIDRSQADWVLYVTGQYLNGEIPVTNLERAWGKYFPNIPQPDFTDPEYQQRLVTWWNHSLNGKLQYKNPPLFGTPSILIESDNAPTSNLERSGKDFPPLSGRNIALEERYAQFAYDAGFSLLFVPEDTRHQRDDDKFPDQPVYLDAMGITDEKVVSGVQNAIDEWRASGGIPPVRRHLGMEWGLYAE